MKCAACWRERKLPGHEEHEPINIYQLNTFNFIVLYDLFDSCAIWVTIFWVLYDKDRQTFVNYFMTIMCIIL